MFSFKQLDNNCVYLIVHHQRHQHHQHHQHRTHQLFTFQGYLNITDVLHSLQVNQFENESIHTHKHKTFNRQMDDHNIIFNDHRPTTINQCSPGNVVVDSS